MGKRAHKKDNVSWTVRNDGKIFREVKFCVTSLCSGDLSRGGESLNWCRSHRTGWKRVNPRCVGVGLEGAPSMWRSEGTSGERETVFRVKKSFMED